MYTPSQDCLMVMRSPEIAKGVRIEVRPWGGLDADGFDLFGGFLPMSVPAQLADRTYRTDARPLAVLERGGFSLAGAEVPPDGADPGYEVGVWSDAVSGDGGAMSWTFNVWLSSPVSGGFELHTDRRLMQFGPSEVLVDVREASVRLYTRAGIDGINPVVAEGPLDCSERGVMRWEGSDTEWQGAQVTVARLSAEGCHVRLTELELWGESAEYTGSDLLGDVTVIMESDPYLVDMPLHELDFTLDNHGGAWDADSPCLAEVAVGSEVSVEIVARWADGGVPSEEAVPMGSYVVTDRAWREAGVRVTCMDPRCLMDEKFPVWDCPAGEYVKKGLEEVLEREGFAFDTDRTVAGPVSKGFSFDGSASLSEIVRSVGRAYGVWVAPTRTGLAINDLTYTRQEYGEVPEALLGTWPAPVADGGWTDIKIPYGDGSVTVPLRAARTGRTLTIRDPLVTDRATAMDLSVRIEAKGERVSVDWNADCLPDPGDVVVLPGRRGPSECVAAKLVTVYDGSVHGTMEAVR